MKINDKSFQNLIILLLIILLIMMKINSKKDNLMLNNNHYNNLLSLNSNKDHKCLPIYSIKLEKCQYQAMLENKLIKILFSKINHKVKHNLIINN